MSEKRGSSVKDKGSTPDKAKKEDKVDKKESQALLNAKSPRDETTHKRSSSYRDSPDKGSKAGDGKNDKDSKDKGVKVLDPKKVRYEDVMSPDDPLTMVKELLLEQAAQIASEEELHVHFKYHLFKFTRDLDQRVRAGRLLKGWCVWNRFHNGPIPVLLVVSFHFLCFCFFYFCISSKRFRSSEPHWPSQFQVPSLTPLWVFDLPLPLVALCDFL